jgi:HlyD family type I secretion membrane fusion protein
MLCGKVMGPTASSYVPGPAQLDLRPLVLAGFAILAITFGALGGWAALAPLAGGVVASGTVTVDSNRKRLQHPDGGVIKEILAQNGEHVHAGQVLVLLDRTMAESTLGVIQVDLETARAQEARLMAERNKQSDVVFPPDLLSQSDTPRIVDILATQRYTFRARRSSHDGQISILNERIAQLYDQIAGLSAQQQAAGRQLSLIQDELGAKRQLLAKGLIELPKVLALEREAARLEGEQGELTGNIAKAKQTIGETRLQIIQVDNEAWEKTESELRDVQSKIFDLQERQTAARHVLDNIAVRAPEDGIVVNLSVHTPGGVIKPGETMLEIVPDHDRLVVEVHVRPLDIPQLIVGQESEIRFPAFRRRVTPNILGKLAYVSADNLKDERTGEPYYLARIEASKEQVARLGDQHLQPGLPADVLIKTTERTAFEYLTQPLVDCLAKAWRER